jgi:hypothetical protein
VVACNATTHHSQCYNDHCGYQGRDALAHSHQTQVAPERFTGHWIRLGSRLAALLSDCRGGCSETEYQLRCSRTAHPGHWST